MPQNQSKPVAPLNNDPRWPDGYVRVLREAGAQERTIPYCLSWVRMFFAQNPGRRRRDLGRSEIEKFLAETAKRPTVSNWQIQQARDALELYYEQFRGIPLEPRHDGSVPARASFPTPSVRSDPATAPSYTRTSPARKEFVEKNAVRRSNGGPTTRPAHVPGTTSSAQPVRPAGAQRTEIPPPLPTAGTDRVDWSVLERVVRDRLRIGHYSYSTEQTYLAWIRRFVVFHGWRKPSKLEAEDVQAFLRHLAVDEQVVSSTQNQAA